VSNEAETAVQTYAETTMPNPHLPVELLDHIIDHLHDTEDALRNCCLVSKPWIPQSRKHLFAHVLFGSEDDLESWRGIFPDPSTSPGHYTKTLTIQCPHAITAADAEVGGWIRGFSHVVHLWMGSQRPYEYGSEIFPAVLQALSPVVKSLNIDCLFLSSSRTFDLILSFPLLEDLSLTNYCCASIDEDDDSDELPIAAEPSNLPVFTGSFKIVTVGLVPLARQLLSLPGGIHFRKFTLTWEYGGDISLIAALVEGCSHTLESLDIGCNPFGASIWYLRPYR